MDGLAWVRKQVEQADTDLLREMVKLFCERVMGEEVDAICGASYGERSDERTNRRNGYRTRAWDTRTGTIDLAVPKLREGSYFPDWLLEPRRRAERAFVQGGCEAYGTGGGARQGEGLGGWGRWSARQTSGACRPEESRASCATSGSSGSPRAASRRWPRSSTRPSRPSAPVRSMAVPTRTSGSTGSPTRCERADGSPAWPAWSRPG